MKLDSNFGVKKNYPFASVYPFIVAIDTREQRPFDFETGNSEAKIFTIKETLKTGDYSVYGFENKISVERKSKADLFGSVTSGRERFEREFARLAKFERKCLVCEASQASILEGISGSQVDPAAVLRTAISWSGRYGVPFFFCTSRAEAEWLTLEFLRFSWEDLTGQRKKKKHGPEE